MRRDKSVLKNVVFALLVVTIYMLTGLSSILPADYERLFPDIEGWEKPEEIDVYYPETLWDIINGAADLFNAYDFRELYWGEYVNSEDNSIYLVMEIYRQGGPVRAYGAYSQERPRTPELIDVGVQGYTIPGGLNFFVDDCYVKIRSHDTSQSTAEAIKKLANHVSEELDPNPEFPDIVHSLPEEGKVEYSDQFINTNFLGHPFLSRAFVNSYEIDGENFNLFIIKNEEREQSEEIMTEYYEFSSQDVGEIKEGIHRIDDRWNGEVGIVWKDNLLYGYYNLDDEELQDKYLDFFWHN